MQRYDCVTVSVRLVVLRAFVYLPSSGDEDVPEYSLRSVQVGSSYTSLVTRQPRPARSPGRARRCTLYSSQYDLGTWHNDQCMVSRSGARVASAFGSFCVTTRGARSRPEVDRTDHSTSTILSTRPQCARIARLLAAARGQ